MSLLKRYQKKSKDRSEIVFTGLTSSTMDYSYAIAKKFLQNDSDIQDAVQSAYIKAWNSFGKFESEKSKFTTWFYSILRNECLDRLRVKNRAPVDNTTQTHEPIIDDSLAYDLRETHRLILDQAEKLSKSQREIFLMRDVEGLSIKEVAESTGKSEGSIKSNLFLARKNIRTWMTKEEIK